MELEKLKNTLQSEYNILLLELKKLKKEQEKIEPLYLDLEEKYLNIYNEVMYLQKDLNNDTNQEVKREEEFIDKQISKQSLKLRILTGTIFLILLLITFTPFLFITNNYTIAKIPLIIGFSLSSFSIGYRTGGIIYLSNKNKYENKITNEYKKTKEHIKHSNNHYDKQLFLERKCKELDNIYTKYKNIEKEYKELTRQIQLKEEEIEKFKIKAFNILFTPPQDALIRETKELHIQDTNDYYKQPIPIKKRKLTIINPNDEN